MSLEERQRLSETNFVIWVDGTIDKTKDDCRYTIEDLRAVVNRVESCTTVEKCIQQLNRTNEQTAFVICSGAFGQILVPKIHDVSKVDSIFIFCGNKQWHELWAKNWAKIKGVHTSIKPLCEALKIAVKEYNENSVPLSIVPVCEEGSRRNLNQLEPTFMYTQIFKEILLEMEHDQNAFQDLVNYCKDLYANNTKEINMINEFEQSYQPSKAIEWYTRECFAYKMLNGALRTLNGDIIIRMGFFLCDLHRQIEFLYKQQLPGYQSKSFTVYRGQRFRTTDLEKLSKNKAGLLSFNSFLSTSMKRDVSLRFANRESGKHDGVGILFQIKIDSEVSSIPFASIIDITFHKIEDEVLFSMHTVFRIDDITKLHMNRELYQVDLKLTSDDDKQLRQLTDRIREEASGPTRWLGLAKLLLSVGQYSKAEQLYTALLEQTTNDKLREHIYHHIGVINLKQGQQKQAVQFYENSIERKRKTTPEDDISLAATYNNVALAYQSVGDYSKALEYYNKALKIREISLPQDHPDLAISYNNIGSVYHGMSDYRKAFEYYHKALKIREISLPPHHPDMANSYNNIGVAYHNMGDNSKAGEYFNEALKIAETSLPQNHPDYATSYHNIGLVYHRMGDYSKALEYFNKALEIREISLPQNHPDLGTSCNNIGSVYNGMGDCSKALEYFNKALEISQISLPQYHPNVALSYNNIGSLYHGMGDYPKALEYMNKALKIREISLPQNHPDVADSYNNIGSVYGKMGDDSKALEYINKALKIREISIPQNHRDVADSYNNIGSVYGKMGDDSKALEYYNKALKITEISLPQYHPNVANSYHNIGSLYHGMGDYPKALEYYHKAHKIFEKSFPQNHPDVANSYNNTGLVYHRMGDYSKALEYFNKALKIREISLTQNHADAAISSIFSALLKYSSAFR